MSFLRGVRVKTLISAAVRTSKLSNSHSWISTHACTRVKPIGHRSLRLQQARFLSTEENAVREEENRKGTKELLLNDIEKRMFDMDETARNWSRVDYEDVRDVYNKVKKFGTVSSQHGLMLLRCYGSLMRKISPEKRTKMLNETWQFLKSTGMEFKIVHYNAWLRVSSENKAQISVTEFLEEIEGQNISPNRVTYQLLIDKYCEDGDIVGASKILEHMKNLDIPVTDVVFHSLIKGHMHQGNPEGAKSILDSMSKAGLEPNSGSYTAILCGYASQGNMEGIKQTISDAQKEDIMLAPRDYFEGLLTLCQNNHTELADQLLNIIPFNGRYNLDLMHCVDQLLVSDHIDIALKLYGHLEDTAIPASNDYIEKNPGAQNPSMRVLRILIVNQKPAEVIFNVLDHFKSKKKECADLDTLARLALVYDPSENALTYIEAMHKKGMPVRLHYYWPIYINMTKNNNLEGLMKAVKSMMTYSEDKVDALMTIAYNVGNALKAIPGITLEESLSKLKEAGVPDEMLKVYKFYEQMRQGTLGQALESAQDGLIVPEVIVKSVLKDAIRNSNEDYTTVIEILSHLKAKNNRGYHELINLMITSLSASKNLKGTAVEEVLDMLIEKGLQHGLDSTMKTTIQTRFSRKDVSEDLIKNVMNFSSKRPEGSKWKPLTEMDTMELRSLFDQRVSRNQPVDIISPMLIEKYFAKKKKVPTATLR